MSDLDSVRVAVRIRPLVKSESDRGFQSIIDKVPDEPQVVFKNNDSFTFNFVYAPNFSQEFVYEDAVKPMIQKLFKGYNVTILAYGQTGSGKTHTMGTAFDGNFGPETGVIPRAMHDIFKQIADMTDHQFHVTCSFMELYQEQLYDLLSGSSREQSVVDIREDGNKGIIIPGLTETSVASAKETTNCLIKGSAGRAVGATAMNAQSSRSHAIFTLTIQMMKEADTNSSTCSKFHLVDLAGSERSKKTKATGDRFKEGVKINQGLLALGNVISALGSSNGTGYVGYRDSKLTRLLQDSLGGNSVTLMIACVSPADYNMDETLSTLRYADRARKIKNKPVVNQDPKTAEIDRLNSIIQKLRLELLSKGGSRDSVKAVGNSQETENLQKQVDILIEKNRNLQNQLQATLHDVADVEMRAAVAESAHEELYNKITEINHMVESLHKEFNEESCPNEMVEKAKKFGEIKKAVEDITGVLEKNKEDMLDHKKTLSNAGSSVDLSRIEGAVSTEVVQKKVDAFNRKQLDLNYQLREINKQLGLKEALHQQLRTNHSDISIYDDKSDERLKEYENMIQALEIEKAELEGKLKNVKGGNPSAKIAEERRIRLQQLEHQLAELRKKNVQQEKMLKIREKEHEKINNLSKEIQEMRQSKVKLIRTMRTESESFRQWKLSREKEITQLKEKDRKRQYEMVRMESMHNKKENVLKRKVEEALAANKRLKEAMDRHKTAQSQRKNINSGKVEHLIAWIDQELEIIMSVVDAKHSIEQLMEDRASLTSRLQEIKDSSTGNAKDLSSIEDEIQMRNAQINDLQQRVISSDIEAKMKSVAEGLQSMPEARAAIKHLFNAVIEMRKEYTVKDNKLMELKSACESAEERISELEKEMEMTYNKHKEELAVVEKNYEETITVLLKELNSCPKANVTDANQISESQKIQLEHLDKMEQLREELEHLKELCRQYEDMNKSDSNGKTQTKPKNKALRQIQLDEESFWFVESNDEEIYDDKKDPDWVRPAVRHNNSRENSQNNTLRGTKRGSDGLFRCSCKASCATRACTCRKNSTNCSENCKCGERCRNRIKEENDEKSFESNASISDCPIVNETTNQIVNETIIIGERTPQKSLLPNESISQQVETPSYPFAKKKHKPFFA